MRTSIPLQRALTTASRLFLATAVLAAPLALGAPAPQRAAADIAKSHCLKCHEAGTAGAPKPGDTAAWAPRLNRGIDALVLTAIRGHGGMPPRGGTADLTDGELRGAILYLYNPAGPPKAEPKGAKAPPLGGAGPKRATAGGMDIYLGRTSAERLRSYPPGSPEAKMHGGIPSGSGYHHVSISVFDAASQAPVAGAAVELDVEQVGMGRQPAKLEAMSIAGSTGYGAYVRLVPKASYVFAVRVRKPGGEAVEVTFREKAD